MGSLIGGPPKPPAPPPPTPMPDPADPAVLAAQRQALQASMTTGRAGTLLSGGTDDYSGTKLGVK